AVRPGSSRAELELAYAGGPALTAVDLAPYPREVTRRVKRVLIIVQNLPVPFDRRVWLECQALIRAGYRVAVVCPKGKEDPAFQVIDGVELYKYRPYAPGGSKLSFVAEYAYSFAATSWKTLRARARGRGGLARGRFSVIQA